MKITRKITALVLSLCLMMSTFTGLGISAFATGTEEEATQQQTQEQNPVTNNSNDESWSGAGTAEDPYLIQSLEDLKKLAENVNADTAYKDTYFKQTADISGVDFCIGSYTSVQLRKPFSGIYDGNSKTTTLSINKTNNYVGMFAYTLDATIKNVITQGEVKAANGVGGICGYFSGIIQNCTNKATVDASENVGGICGKTSGRTIENCFNKGKISATNGCSGGICGYAMGSINLTNCYNSGSIAGNTAGSICGKVDSTASVTKSYYLDGSSSAGATGEGSFTECYKFTKEEGKAPVIPDLGGVQLANQLNQNRKDLTKQGEWLAWAEGEDKYPYLFDWAGAGTSDNPYLIQNLADLKTLSDKVNAGNTYSGIYFKQTADISDVDFCIGDYTDDQTNKPFSGFYDGNGKTTTLSINKTNNYAGMFAYTLGATIKNVITQGEVTVPNFNYIGGICGFSSSSSIQNCTNVATVSGKFCVGGICGECQTSSYIENCLNKGNISATNGCSGGICASSSSSSIQNCTNEATVSGNSCVGGICGECQTSSYIENCLNKGNISATMDYSGGICAKGFINLKNCYNSGSVEGTTAGSLYGKVESEASVTKSYYPQGSSPAGDSSSVETCYEFTKEEGAAPVIPELSNINLVEQLNQNRTDAKKEGKWLMWVEDENLYPCFRSFNIEIDSVIGGKITANPECPFAGETVTLTVVADNNYKLQEGSIHIIGYDSDGIAKDYTPDSNYKFEMPSYDVVVKSRFTLETQPTATEPVLVEGSTDTYAISTVNELLWFKDEVNTGHASNSDSPGEMACAKLVADIDMSGVDWEPIGRPQSEEKKYYNYYGTFDGNGHKISNLSYSGTDSRFGLIRELSSKTDILPPHYGKVKNVNLDNVNIYIQPAAPDANNTIAVGGIVAYGSGDWTERPNPTKAMMENCTVSGSIIGNMNNVANITTNPKVGIGGVCGITYLDVRSCSNSATIKIIDNSISKGNLEVYAGGIAGKSEASLNNNTNSGNISANSLVDTIGGLCGYTSDTVYNCMNTGEIQGKDIIGGLCGLSTGGTIENCGNTGEVKGTDYVGGIVGNSESKSKLLNCYNSAKIDAPTGSTQVGAIAGQIDDNSFLQTSKEYYLDHGDSIKAVGGRDDATGQTISCTSSDMAELADSLNTNIGNNYGKYNEWQNNANGGVPTFKIYTVKFDGNGTAFTEETKPADQQRHTAEIVSRPPINPETAPENYKKFSNWIRTSSGNLSFWDFTESLYYNVVEQGKLEMQDPCVYALWEDALDVTFDVQGHGTAPETQKLYKGDKITEPTNPTEPGYTFGGWYKEKECANEWDFNNDTVQEATTLYAKWTENSSYILNYELNGGTGDTKKENIKWTDANLLPSSNPTKDGCTFDGWNTKADGTGNPVTNATKYSELAGGQEPAEGGITIYAQWLCVVSFDTQGHGTAPSPQVISVGGKATKPSTDPTATGYTFKGWFKDTDCKETWDFDNDTVSVNTTIYAKWEATQYTVQYDAQGGSTIADKTGVEWNQAGLLPETPPTKAGYNFAGWFKEATCTNAVTSATKYSELSGETEQTSVTIYAKWTENDTYKLNYDVNGGTSTIEQKTSIKWTDANLLPSTNPTRNGFTFDSWNTKADGKGNTVTNEATYSGLAGGQEPSGGEITIYAKWTENGTYKLNYDVNGGTSTIEQKTNIQWTAANLLPSSDPTRDSCTFNGWNTKQDGTGNPVTKATTYSELAGGQEPTGGEITIYAQWTCVVTFDVQEHGTTPDPQVISVGGNATKPSTDPTATGYTFNSWCSDKAGTTTWDFNTAINGNTTIYAKWVASKYTVNYDTQGGSEVTAKTDAEWDQAGLLPSTQPTKLGYNFAGWFKEVDCTNEVTSDTKYSELSGETEQTSVTIYAKWTDNTYTVYFDANGGVASTETSKSVKWSDTNLLPTSNPTMVGYEVSGWNTKPDGTGSAVTSTTKYSDLVGNIEQPYTTIYAQWTPKTGFTVKYNTDGKATVPDKTGVQWDQSGLLPAEEPSYQGYIFKGWYRDGLMVSVGADTTFADLAGETEPTDKSVTIYAKWLKLCTVTFDVQGHGTAPDAQSLAQGDKVIRPTEDPQAIGYTFNNWYEDQECTTEWNFNDKTVSDHTTIYAKWTPKTGFTVHYDTGEGEKIDDKSDVGWEDANLLPSTTPVRAGYNFEAWYKEEYYQTKVTNNTTYAELSGEEEQSSVRIYAKWTEKTNYTLHFDLNEGTSVKPSDRTGLAWNESNLRPTEDPTRSGYTFAGWFTQPDADGRELKDQTTIFSYLAENTEPENGELTVYARWTEKTNYTLHFDLNGGTSEQPGDITGLAWSANNLRPTEDPTKNGYNFVGWFTVAEPTGGIELANNDTTFAELAGGTEPENSEITVYARWSEKNNFVVKYNTNGGTLIADKTGVKWNDSNLLPSNSPTKSGYTFLGWNTQEDGKGTTVENSTKYSDLSGTTEQPTITIFARWSASPSPTYYTIQATATGGGKIAPTGQKGAVYVAEGENQTFTATSGVGYKFEKFVVDGKDVQVNGNNSYTFSSVMANHTIQAVFAKDEVVKSISVTKMPIKTEYKIGETLDTTGLVITATYDNGTTADVTGYTLSEFDSSTAGNKTITVTYGGKTTSFNVNVVSNNGWNQNSRGQWMYFENGVAVTNWQQLNWSSGTNWFYFDVNGVMQTSWQLLNWSQGTDWFYFNSNGTMATGWQSGIPGWVGRYFFFDCSTGVMKTGWHLLPWSVGTNWFCFNTGNGVMYANCTTPDGYVVDADGVWRE